MNYCEDGKLCVYKDGCPNGCRELFAASGQPEIDRLIQCGFLGDRDPDFRSFVDRMPVTHWAKYDLSAVRLGWEAYKVLHVTNTKSELCRRDMTPG